MPPRSHGELMVWVGCLPLPSNQLGLFSSQWEVGGGQTGADWVSGRAPQPSAQPLLQQPVHSSDSSLSSSHFSFYPLAPTHGGQGPLAPPLL